MQAAGIVESASEVRISADSHMGEPPDLWEERLPPRFKGRALRFPNIKPLESNHHLRAGCWDPRERLKDLAIDGISAEVLYPRWARKHGSSAMWSWRRRASVSITTG